MRTILWHFWSAKLTKMPSIIKKSPVIKKIVMDRARGSTMGQGITVKEGTEMETTTSPIEVEAIIMVEVAMTEITEVDIKEEGEEGRMVNIKTSKASCVAIEAVEVATRIHTEAVVIEEAITADPRMMNITKKERTVKVNIRSTIEVEVDTGTIHKETMGVAEGAGPRTRIT